MDALQFEEFGSYWTKSETYESLRIYIDMNEDGLQDAVYHLLSGAHIPLEVDTFQNDLSSITGKDDVLTLLVHLGYLVYHREEGTVSIPNNEIQKEFSRAVRKSHHQSLIRLIRKSEELLEATCRMEEHVVAEAITEIHSRNTAPLFYNNEQALRSVIRMAYLTCIDEYQEIQELPGGTGYADIVFIPKKRSSRPAMIIELKWNKTAQSALTQIRNRSYPQILEGLSDEILLVGISYDEKTKVHECKIEMHSGFGRE